MKRIFFLVAFMVTGIFAFSQSTLYLRADTIRAFKQGDSAFLKADSFLVVTKQAVIGKVYLPFHPYTSLLLADTNRAIRINKMFSRTNIVTPLNGMFIYEDSTDQFLRREAGAWLPFGGGADLNFAEDDLTATGNRTHTFGANTAEITFNSLAGASGFKISSTSTAAASNLQKLFEVSASGANANSSQTTYGAFISNTHTGTSSFNQGLSVDASGATTNYAIVGQSIVGGGTTNVAGYFSAGNATNNYGLLVNGGNVGIGTLSPVMKLQINSGRFGQFMPTAIAAANDLTLTLGNSFFVEGSTTINAIITTNWQQGSIVNLFFDGLSGVPTLKHNTSGGAGTAPMILSGAVDFVTDTNDVITFLYNGTNWVEVSRNTTSTSGGGSGTVTSVSFTDGNGFDGTVTNPTTTPAISLAIANPSFEDWYTVTDEMFMDYKTIFDATSGGAGAIAYFYVMADNLPDGWAGGASLVVGTTTSGNAGVYITASAAGALAPISLGGGLRQNIGYKIQIPTLSDGTDTYIFSCGFADAALAPTSASNGVYFEYQHTLNSGNWTCTTESGGTKTQTNSGIPVAINTDYELEISVFGGNAYFYINKTLVATTGTNIPAASAQVGGYSYMYKTAGTTSRSYELDWAKFGTRKN